ncbi:MAG: DNA-binding protein [Candidatus Nitrosotenuis sp.]
MISMEETQDHDQVFVSQPYIYHVRNVPIMQAALDVFMLINKHRKGVLRAKGNSIPNAVAIANIIVEKMLHGSCLIEHITLDSENVEVFGKRMLSTIEISIVKN